MNTRVLIVTVGLACATAWPGPARAADARLAGRLDPATAADVDRIVTEARERRLPADPLISKAIEGAAKGARSDRILAAVRAEAAALDSARAWLGAASSDAELMAGAGALLAGAPPESLARLRALRERQSLVVPLVVLADLVARRVPAAAASGAVLVATRAGAGDVDLLRLRQRIERDIEGGASPATTAILRARTLDLRGGPDKRAGAGAGGTPP
ncbi:MAG: hypothetical protein HY076_02485 [Candidatus Eisenbacteria bacterium]|uniref:Uncharacterized protein n=1 Tax=Eiseniibacteriota bacterium TaxID=2212470 RepID=A0A9D6QIB1_UNCEI|nr:hypothetical protein [Candidatus Eisenbacteria bacterium]MBI3539122.1 hypothetical protein [Candidatus Eisenbacteria bacterium]